MRADRTDVEERQFQFGGNFVVTSSASPDAWIAVEQPVLAADQIDTEVTNEHRRAC